MGIVENQGYFWDYRGLSSFIMRVHVSRWIPLPMCALSQGVAVPCVHPICTGVGWIRVVFDVAAVA